MPETQNHATALVTGAALRLGRAIALDLAKLGWRIGVHYQTSSAEAEGLVEEIERLGSKAVALPADLTSEDQLRGLVQSCAEKLGPPTCLINNAARFEWDSIETLDWGGWQAELDVNLRAPIFLTQEFARTLAKDASGCVINMIDQRVWRLTPRYFSYTLSKSALWTATRTMAQAFAPRIRVNGVGPGPVFPNEALGDRDFEIEAHGVPLGHAADVSGVVDAVVFLSKAKSVTGQMIAVDSGQHLAWRTPDVSPQ